MTCKFYPTNYRSQHICKEVDFDYLFVLTMRYLFCTSVAIGSYHSPYKC